MRELSQKQTIFNRPSWPIHFRIETSDSMKAANFHYHEFCEKFGHGLNLFYTSMPQQIWAKPFILFQNCQESSQMMSTTSFSILRRLCNTMIQKAFFANFILGEVKDFVAFFTELSWLVMLTLRFLRPEEGRQIWRLKDRKRRKWLEDMFYINCCGYSVFIFLFVYLQVISATRIWSVHKTCFKTVLFASSQINRTVV